MTDFDGMECPACEAGRLRYTSEWCDWVCSECGDHFKDWELEMADASGECDNCSGSGDCNVCGGSGICNECNGTGGVPIKKLEMVARLRQESLLTKRYGTPRPKTIRDYWVRQATP